MKRHTIPALAAAALLALTAACGSDPIPAPESLGNSEVDRSSAEATAVAFANMYATGDVPAACQLANDHGKERIGGKCAGRQVWSTTVALKSDCESVPTVPTAEAQAFLFEAPVGSLNRESRLRVEVEKSVNEPDMWWVTSASTPYIGEPYSPCLAAQPSSVVLTPASSSGSSSATTTSG